MQKLLDFTERFLATVLNFLVERVPMPDRVRSSVRAKKATLHEIVKFGIAGVGATVTFWPLYLLLITIFRDHLPTQWAMVIANIPAIAIAYWISAKFVFTSHSGQNHRAEITMFFVLNAAAVALAYFALGLTEWVLGMDRLPMWLEISVVVASFLGSWVLRFVIAKLFIFKAHLERPPVDVATELAHLVEEIEEEDDPTAERRVAEA